VGGACRAPFVASTPSNSESNLKAKSSYGDIDEDERWTWHGRVRDLG
jgi:hypothetical protein